MPPVCCPQCFLLLMNYSCPWPGGRSIMQKGETLAGPSFQLTGSAPAPGKDCPQPSRQWGHLGRHIQLSSGLQAGGGLQIYP